MLILMQEQAGQRKDQEEPKEKNLGLLVDEKLNLSWQRAVTAQKPGLHPKQCGQQAKEGDSGPLTLMRPHP